MSEAVWLVVGALLVAGGTVWRTRFRSRRHNEIARALVDADPAVRATALQVLASSGLRRWSALLADRIRLLDPHTLSPDQEAIASELAWLIGVCQWEPADEPAILQLRLWAKLYHQVRDQDHGLTGESTRLTLGEAARRAPVDVGSGPIDGRNALVAAAEHALGEPVLEVRFWPSTSRSAAKSDAG